eukprot:6202662-Pleurochrysis_carterae.AAC.3
MLWLLCNAGGYFLLTSLIGDSGGGTQPYVQVPYTGKRLGRLIIKFLPAALAGEGCAPLRDLFDKNALGKESCVIQETMRLVKIAHVAVPVSEAYKGPSKKDKEAIAAPAMGPRKNGGASGGAPRGGAPYEFPNGQRCSKGTCHFTHDKENRGGPCYRDPRWPGPLPAKVLKKYSRSSVSRARAGEQVIDVNGIEMNLTLVNAVKAASGDPLDDQGEHTDPSLDFAVSKNTSSVIT